MDETKMSVETIDGVKCKHPQSYRIFEKEAVEEIALMDTWSDIL
ncbi:Uncharacterised protein [uncultured archaeon]|nr:Uncharacterised protein [uncultured archaeon]